jgi:hypothetical protein
MFILGIVFLIGGLISILTCFLVVAILGQGVDIYLGIEGSTNILAYLNYFGMLPYFLIAIAMAIVGKCVCLYEIYSSPNKECCLVKKTK